MTGTTSFALWIFSDTIRLNFIKFASNMVSRKLLSKIIFLRQLSCVVLAGGLCLLAQGGWAEVEITQVNVNGEPRRLQWSSTNQSHFVEPLKLRSSDKSVEFAFAETAEDGDSLARLRYKLDGYDSDWCDLTNLIEMRMTLQFMDTNSQILGIDSFAINGETPGWAGKVEDSEFVDRQIQVTVPNRAIELFVVILSQGPESIVGVAAFDNISLKVEHPISGAAADHYDLTVKGGNDLTEPMGTPDNWGREGTRASMSELGIRLKPSPHPVLVLNDTDASRFSTWTTRNHPTNYPVQSGDRVTLTWQCAHSIGLGGPGSVMYPRLKPGRYWFRVAAARPNGELTGREISLPVEVVPPFTQQPLFWGSLACVTAVLGTILGRIIQRNRMKRRLVEIERLNVLENERARIARDLHDDVGAGLTEIAMKSDLVRRALDHSYSPETRRHIERICQSAIELTRSVDEIVWAVNPANDTLLHFVNYVTQSTEQFLNATGLRVRFDIPATLPDIELSGKMRHLIFLVVREALNNAVKHAHATLIRLEVKFSEKTLRIIIEDDGQGFASDQHLPPGTHQGLEGMRRRLEEIGGRFELITRPGGGTQVELIAPLDSNKK
jgi:signal transduction histidine kinase